MILDGFLIGILLALILNITILWILILLFPNHGTLRQNIIIFVAQGVLGYMDFKDDIMAVVMAHTAKPKTTPKQRMNGLLDSYFSELQKA